jgi:hypothetical protein
MEALFTRGTLAQTMLHSTDHREANSTNLFPERRRIP